MENCLSQSSKYNHCNQSVNKQSEQLYSKQMQNRHRKYTPLNKMASYQEEFANYLHKRGYHQTYAAFQREIAKLSTIPKHDFGEMTFDQFKAFLEEKVERGLTGVFRGSHSHKSQTQIRREVLKTKFYLLVWYTFYDSHRESTRMEFLKEYISKEGSKLSQIPQLLPYFAMPYLPNPSSHPHLQHFFTREWREQMQETLRLVLIHCEPKPVLSVADVSQVEKQSEWLKIVKDLINICMYLDGGGRSRKSEEYQAMMVRVRNYAGVIQDNDVSDDRSAQASQSEASIQPSELSRIAQGLDLLAKGEKSPLSQQNNLLLGQSVPEFGNAVIASEKQIDANSQVSQAESCESSSKIPINYAQLRIRLKQKITSKPQSESFALGMQIYHCLLHGASGEHVHRQMQAYMHYDLLFFDEMNSIGRNNGEKQERNQLCRILSHQIEYLKLVQKLCILRTCREKLPQSLLQHLCHNINKQNNSIASLYTRERITLSLSILQKISLGKKNNDKIRDYPHLVESLVEHLLAIRKCGPCYSQIDCERECYCRDALTYVFALLMNMCLYRQGREKCSKMKVMVHDGGQGRKLSFIELIVRIWEKEMKYPIDSESKMELESLFYSLLYLLLSLRSSRKAAQNISLKQLMQNFLNESGNADEYHVKVISHIMDRLEGQSEQNEEEEEELDQSSDEEQELEEEGEDMEINLVWIGEQRQEISNGEIDTLLREPQIPQIINKKENEQAITAYSPQKYQNQAIRKSVLCNHDVKIKIKVKEKHREEQENLVSPISNNQGYNAHKYKLWKSLYMEHPRGENKAGSGV